MDKAEMLKEILDSCQLPCEICGSVDCEKCKLTYIEDLDNKLDTYRKEILAESDTVKEEVEILWDDIRKAIDSIPVPEFIDPPGNKSIANLIKHKAKEIITKAEQENARLKEEIVNEAIDKAKGEG